VVHWTITLERRAAGWLNDRFHFRFRELLLHAAAREGLFCPVYCLMPDHAHLVWMGLRLESDQRNAMRFLRKHLAIELSRHAPIGVEFELQKQSHDNVLREKDRMRGAFEKTCFYVLNNPRRKELVSHPREWPHLGAVVPGYLFSIRWRKITGNSSGNYTNIVSQLPRSGASAERRFRLLIERTALCRDAATVYESKATWVSDKICQTGRTGGGLAAVRRETVRAGVV